MPTDDVLLTKKIARLRVHVAKSNWMHQRILHLHSTLPAATWDSRNEVIYVCCMLTNFSPPLVS